MSDYPGFPANPQLLQYWDEHPEYDGARKENADVAISFVPLQANASGQRAFITAPKNVDLVLTGAITTCLALDSRSYVFLPPPMSVTYVNDAEGRIVNDVPLDVYVMAGLTNSGLAPVVWPWPMLIRAGTQFSVLVNNPQAMAFNVFFNFPAVKIFLDPSVQA